MTSYKFFCCAVCILGGRYYAYDYKVEKNKKLAELYAVRKSLAHIIRVSSAAFCFPFLPSPL